MHSLPKLIKKTYHMAHPHDRKVVIGNAASLASLQAVTYLLPIVIVPYLFRVIGAEKFGLIAFAQAFVQYFMIVTDYGFSITATKEISLCQDEHHKVAQAFSSVMTVKLALAALSFAILCLIVFFIPKFRHDWLVYFLSFGSVIGNTLFPVWFFQGTEKMNYITGLNILGGAVFAACIFYFVRQPGDYLMVPSINSAVFIVTGVLAQYIVFRRFRIAFKFQGYKSLRQQLKAGWDIFISIAAINAYTTTRIFTMGLLTNNTITGFYSMAEKIANACQTFPLTSFSQAVFPRLSQIFHKNKATAVRMMQRIQQIVVSISLIALPVIFIFSHSVVKVICGRDYPEAALTLRLLLIAVFFVHANAFRVQFLLVCGKTHIYSRIHVVAAIVGMPLIFLLIQSFSYLGAAIATIIIEASIFTITYFTVRRLTFD